MILNKLPYPIKRVGRFAINCIRQPYKIPQHFNLLQCERKTGRVAFISFVPPVLGVTITRKCNLKCPTCLYVLEDSPNNNAMMNEYAFVSMLNKLDLHRRASVISITGGEPFLNPNLKKIIEAGESLGYTINLSTNGTLLHENRDVIQMLDHINVSLDAWDTESYRVSRNGTPAQWTAILRGIETLKESKTRFSLSFVLHRDNICDIQQMFRFAEMVGAPEVVFHNINPHGSGYVALETSQKKTMDLLEQMQSISNYKCDLYLPYIFDVGSNEFKESKCIQPWYYCCFDANGDLSPCCHLPHSVENGNVMGGGANSTGMQAHRTSIISGRQINSSCLFCQRRFMNAHPGVFIVGKGWV